VLIRRRPLNIVVDIGVFNGWMGYLAGLLSPALAKNEG
jgi:hypothetical protein